MKIAQVAPLYESVPPKLYGGTERVVSYLTEELVRQGHEITLFAAGDSVTSAKLIPQCEKSLRLDPDSRDSLAHHILMMERVRQLADDFDIIHYHIDYLHFPLSRSTRKPQLTTLHGRLDLPDLAPLYREFSDMPVVSISDAQRTPIPSANWIGTVHHGLPPDLYPLCRDPEPYLAFVGRISPEKRLDRAIEIAKGAGMALRVAAKIDPSDEQYFKGRIAPLLDNSFTEFVGEIGEEHKGDFLGKASAFLFPIDWPEPFGLVMIEAMACGTPVIAFQGGSVSEIIEDGKTGYIVDSIESAVAAVKNISQISRSSCRKIFEDRFSVTRMARDYLTLYSRLIERSGHGGKAA